MNRFTTIITCEHAGNHVPTQYNSLFDQAKEILNTHEGWDPGAWEIATHLSKSLGVTPHGCHTTRLLIEANRSLNSHQLFSKYSAVLDNHERQELINGVYLPYRQSVEAEIQKLHQPVLHLSIHSFTPVWNGKEREVEIGLLFDPDRKSEGQFCDAYANILRELDPHINVQHNEPYRGTDDGFTTHLRGLHDDQDYAGIEIEVNQKFVLDLDPIKNLLLAGLKKAISG